MKKTLKYQYGDRVQFGYKNSVGEKVIAMGTVKDYHNRHFGVDIGGDRPLIYVYGNRLHPFGDTVPYSFKNKKVEKKAIGPRKIRAPRKTNPFPIFVSRDYADILTKILLSLIALCGIALLGAIASYLRIIML